jgi:benzoyl-CoA reductase/2-hydroxyglutaryl-CoA dehydratase subunit BcrC/BadD/HgdB
MMLAAGMLPVRLEADVLHPSHAADRLGADGHPVLRSLVAELLGGRYDFIDRLVIGSSPRNLTALRILIRELHANDRSFARLETCLVDITHAGRPATEAYNRESLVRFREQLRHWSGRLVTDDDLLAAIALCNDTRALLQRFQHVRRDNGDIGGVTALQLHANASSADRGDFNAYLGQWLAQLATSSGSSQPAILYSGTAVETTEAYRLIESAGLRIVDDDQDFGARAAGQAVSTDGDPLAALAFARSHRHPSSVSFSTALRRAHLLQRVADCRPDAVLFHAAAYDHPTGWDLPELRQALDGIGMPHETLDPYCYRDSRQFSAGAQRLASRLEPLPVGASR